MQALAFLSFSLQFSLRFFWVLLCVSDLLLLFPPFCFPAVPPLGGFREIFVLSNPSPYHFLVMKVDFWGVLTIQANRSAFNGVDIRQGELINAVVTITLGFALLRLLLHVPSENSRSGIFDKVVGSFSDGLHQTGSTDYLGNGPRWSFLYWVMVILYLHMGRAHPMEEAFRNTLLGLQSTGQTCPNSPKYIYIYIMSLKEVRKSIWL